MTQETANKLEKIKKLVSQGSSIGAALKQVKISSATYYSAKKGSQDSPVTVETYDASASTPAKFPRKIKTSSLRVFAFHGTPEAVAALVSRISNE